MNDELNIGDPVQTADGRFGQIIRVSAKSDEIGIQVPGEEDIRWMKRAQLEDLGGGAWREKEAR